MDNIWLNFASVVSTLIPVYYIRIFLIWYVAVVTEVRESGILGKLSFLEIAILAAESNNLSDARCNHPQVAKFYGSIVASLTIGVFF